ncbi:MAG TPA: hypothetical protein VHS81_04510 [Caulobacteraceae bacterium]|jgi:hypothetical protein|nr:hypothetical protein [Caulobacteraceae bacterium]
MADPSLSDQALAVLDEALRETNPINRMMLIEQALKLHRRALEARDAALAADAKPAAGTFRRTQR